MRLAVGHGLNALFRAFLLGMLAFVQCVDSDDVLEDVEVFHQALSGPINGMTLHGINGTYSQCLLHTGSWSVAVNGYNPASLPNSALSIVKNNTSCSLNITSVVLNSTTYTYASGSGIALTGNYLNSGVAFQSAGSSAPDFYANAKITPGDYSSNFTIYFLYSADPSAVSASKTAQYSNIAVTTVSDSQVAAPNCTIDLSGLSVVVYTPSNIVQSVTGNVVFTAGSQAPETYKVFSSLASTSDYDTIKAAYTSPTAFSSPQSVSAATLAISGTLTKNPTTLFRYVVFRHLDASTGLASYQIFTIGFPAP